MKKILIAIFCLAAVATAQAQITAFGVRASAGISTITDDLTEKTPIFSGVVGGYMTYGFEKRHSVLSQLVYVNAGINFLRRGGKYYEKFDIAENLTTERTGTYDAYYLQVPVIAQFRHELPRWNRSRQYVSLYAGPSVCVGLLGKYSDRVVTPFMPQREVNYVIDREPAFDYMNRLDVTAIVGIGYEYRNITAGLYMDYGFLSVRDENDAVRTIENGGEATTHPGGNLMAFYFSLGYKFYK